MSVSVTKSVVSKETICAMVNKAFGCEPAEILELTEGFFNVAYRIELEDRPVILKVAPAPSVDILTYEKNIMWVEVDSMKRVKRETTVPVPVAKKKMFALLEKDRAYFEEVTTPKFVHWDIWAGNVFEDHGEVTGIIDFERALWYDIFLFQIARLECDYRQYDNRWAYDWSGEMIPKWVEMLEQAD